MRKLAALAPGIKQVVLARLHASPRVRRFSSNSKPSTALAALRRQALLTLAAGRRPFLSACGIQGRRQFHSRLRELRLTNARRGAVLMKDAVLLRALCIRGRAAAARTRAVLRYRWNLCPRTAFPSRHRLWRADQRLQLRNAGQALHPRIHALHPTLAHRSAAPLVVAFLRRDPSTRALAAAARTLPAYRWRWSLCSRTGRMSRRRLR
mmetsp:Transcript_18172/g.39194  ORF Transcript_18172/g.39194 Transcript_18172/m.39194 type:complete len:208 (-) Transcript_18172:518-1141(-)